MSTQNFFLFNQPYMLSDDYINLFMEEHILEKSKIVGGRLNDCRTPQTFKNVGIVELVMTCGYYGDGTLDYITIKDYFENYIDYNSSLEELASEIKYISKYSKKELIIKIFDLLNEFYFYENQLYFDFNRYNFKSIKKPTKRADLVAFIKDIVNLVINFDKEEAIKELKQEAIMYRGVEIRCKGVFSNGEAVYEVVKDAVNQ